MFVVNGTIEKEIGLLYNACCVFTLSGIGGIYMFVFRPYSMFISVHPIPSIYLISFHCT